MFVPTQPRSIPRRSDVRLLLVLFCLYLGCFLTNITRSYGDHDGSKVTKWIAFFTILILALNLIVHLLTRQNTARLRREFREKPVSPQLEARNSGTSSTQRQKYGAYKKRQCSRILPSTLVLLLSVYGGSAVTYLQHNYTHPPALEKVIDSGKSLHVLGYLASSAEERKMPWGSMECFAQLQPEILRSNTGASLAIRGARFEVKVPCTALAGMRIQARGTLTSQHFGRNIAQFKSPQLQIEGGGYWWARAKQALEARVRDELRGFPPYAQGLIPGVGLGNDAALPQADREAMKTAQLTHLTAVSGGHVALVFFLVFLCIGRAKRVRVAIGASVSLVLLLYLVGLEASVLRASFMGIVAILAVAIKRPSHAPTSLAIAGIVALLMDARLAMSLGFLLSLSATLGIILVSPWMKTQLALVLPSPLAEVAGVSYAASLSCFPILSFMGSPGSLWGVLANLLVAPVVAPLTLVSLAGVLISPLNTQVAGIFFRLAQPCAWWIDRVALWVAELPGTQTGVLLSAGSLAFGLVLIGIARYRRLFCVGVAAALAAAGIGCLNVAPLAREWGWVQCDVGQGSAFIARIRGLVVMVDVGPDESGSRCLREAGIDEVDLLLLSHDHADHVGGLSSVLDEVRVAQVWRSPVRTTVARDLDKILAEHGLHARSISCGAHWKGVLTIISPCQSKESKEDIRERKTSSRGNSRILPVSKTETSFYGFAKEVLPGRSSSRHNLAERGGNSPGSFARALSQTDLLHRVLVERKGTPTHGSIHMAFERESSDVNDASLVVHLAIGDGILILSDVGSAVQNHILNALPPLDTLVMAHHGSADQSPQLAERIRPQTVLISVGENSYGHPSRRALDLYRHSTILTTKECGMISWSPRSGIVSQCKESSALTEVSEP